MKHKEKIHQRWTEQARQCVLRFIASFQRERIRVSGAVGISIAVHTIAIFLLFGLPSMETPDEPPLRRIEFVDLTQIPDPPPAPTKKARPKVRIQRNPAPVVRQPKIAQSRPQAAQKLVTLGSNNQKRFDMQRKQAPIQLTENKSPAINLNKKDVLQISPARGTRRDNKVQMPSRIDLQQGRMIRMAVATKPTKYKLATSTRPALDLTPSNSLELGGPTMPVKHVAVKPVIPGKGFEQLKETQTLITGPLADRPILQKQVPVFPIWARRKGIGATISLRFTVMENGKVKENIIVERTSGSREWDRMVRDALKKWTFAALSKTDVRHDQTGVITFQFVI